MAKKKKKWIQTAIKKPGSLTRQAKAAGKTGAGFCADVKRNPSKYSATTKRRCNLRKTLKKFK